MLAIVAAFALAGLSGGFDWKVVSEAPKSLSYRLQYWRGTAGILREHPILGAGPGNFRQHYLKYKLPESSEEIADPHNMLLDIWSSGGLIALAGFAGFVVCALRARSNRLFATMPAAPVGRCGIRSSLAQRRRLVSFGPSRGFSVMSVRPITGS